MSFAGPVKAWAESAKVKIYDVVKETARIALYRFTIQHRVVGDPAMWQSPPPAGYEPGTFNANWNVSVGSADESVNPAAKDESGNATYAAGLAKIEAAQLGNTIYITNSVPYARRIEYGWSNQAPDGLVRVTVAALPAEIERYINSIR